MTQDLTSNEGDDARPKLGPDLKIEGVSNYESEPNEESVSVSLDVDREEVCECSA